jgi:hypothetical protein
VKLKESQRIVPESVELVKQSRYAASVHNYEHARLLQEMAQSTCQAELERRYERVNIEMKQQIARTIIDQQKEIESLVDRLERGIATIQNSAENDRTLENEMKDVKFIGELTKFTKELVAIAGQTFPVAPYQRELETMLAEIIEVAGLPVPQKLKKNAKTAARPALKSPRPGQ